MIRLSWNELKTIIVSKDLDMQFHETSSRYEIYAIDNGMYLKTSLLKDPSDATELDDFVNNFKSRCNNQSAQINRPFSSKKIGGKSLFKRVHGISQSVSIGTNNIEYQIPYNTCKFIKIEFIGGEVGDNCSLKILAPNNYMLNQFGFLVNIAKDFYHHESKYDADLVKDLKIRLEYNSISEKNIYINLVFDETK